VKNIAKNKNKNKVYQVMFLYLHINNCKLTTGPYLFENEKQPKHLDKL